MPKKLLNPSARKNNFLVVIVILEIRSLTSDLHSSPFQNGIGGTHKQTSTHTHTDGQCDLKTEPA